MGSKPLLIRFDEIDRFTKIYSRIGYLILFSSGQYDASYNRIRYIIIEKGGITDSINHNFDKFNTKYFQMTFCIL